MNKLKTLLLVILMFICMQHVHAEEQKKNHNFDNTNKVYDYAQILSDKEEDKLKKMALDYNLKHNIDMVIVTARHEEKEQTKKYAEEFYKTYDFGIGTTKDGIMIVLDFNVDDTNLEIVPMGNAKNIYSSDRVDIILSNVKNHEKYYDMFESFIEESSKYSKSESAFSTKLKGTISKIPWLLIITISIIVPSIIVIIIIFIMKKEKNNNENLTTYLKEGTLIINAKTDKFVTTHTDSVRVLKNK